MDRVNNTGKMELCLEASSFKDIKSTVSSIGQMVLTMLVSLTKTVYKERANLHTKTVVIIMANGRTI